eukprot:gene11569-13502_t
MAKQQLLSILVIITVLAATVAYGQAPPQTIKLSLTQKPNEMLVSWHTASAAPESVVHFSFSKTSLQALVSGKRAPSGSSPVVTVNGTSTAYGSELWTGFANTVLLTSLQSSSTYFYMCGSGMSSEGLSSIFQFKTSAFANSSSTAVTPFTAAIYADMGYGGGYNNTVSALLKNLNKYDVIFHIGDISYADYDKVEQGNQTIWNDFLNTLQPITSKVPYMTAPGNHDTFYSFTAYQQTFNMPGSSDAPWYSFTYNGVHFISFSTESDLSPFTKQYQWLKADLDAYRRTNPNGWVVAYAHRPYYCSTQWDWCRKNTLRALIESTIGGLFQKYNVDMFLAGHTHAYERTFPVYEQLTIGDYHYPGGTIHMVIGTPGNQEGLDTDWIQPAPSWSAYRYAQLSYAQLNVYNATHILWQLIADKDLSVVDEQWIVKDVPKELKTDLPNFKPIKPPSEAFEKLLDANVSEPPLAKRKLNTYFSTHPKHLTIFLSGIEEVLKDRDFLRLALLPVNTSTSINDSNTYFADSFVKILLSLPSVQSFFIKHLLELAVVFHNDHNDDMSFNYSRMIYSQFRWMENIQYKDLGTDLMNHVSMLCGHPTLRRDLIGFLPEIVDDSNHAIVVESLLEIIEQDNSNTLVIIDALGNLNLSASLRGQARETIFRQLNNADFEALPVIINSLLQSSSGKEAIDTIRQLRSNLNFPTKVLYSSTGSSGGLAHKTVQDDIKIKDSRNAGECLVLESLKTNFKFKKELSSAFLKELNALKKDDSIKVIDLWLLFVIYSFGSHNKDIEQLFKKRILDKNIHKGLVRGALGGHAVALREYFRYLLALCDSFLRTYDQRVRSFGGLFYTDMFKTFDDHFHQKDTIEALIIHIGSGSAGEVDEAIDVLNRLASESLESLFPHLSSIKGILDHISSLNESQTRSILKVFGALSYTTILDNSPSHYSLSPSIELYNEFQIFITKQITNVQIRYKKVGILALCAQIHRLGRVPEKISKAPQYTKLTLDIPKDCYILVEKIINDMLNHCRNSDVSIAYIYDEIVNVYKSGSFSPMIVQWIAEKFEGEFDGKFTLTHSNNLEGVWFAGSKDSDAVNIYPNVSTEGLRDKMICLSPYFRLLQTMLRANNGSLESIALVLEYPLVMYEQSSVEDFESLREKDTYCLSLYYAINWVREIINGFSTQTAEPFQKLVLERLQNLIKLESRFDTLLSHCYSFVLPFAAFQSDHKKNITIDLTKIKKKKDFIAIGEESCEDYHPYIKPVRSHFRQFDLNALKILQQYSKGDTTSQSTGQLVELDPRQLYCLLDDLYSKMVTLTTPEKFNPLNNSAPKQQFTFTFHDLMTDLAGVFPSFTVTSERILHTLPDLFRAIEGLSQKVKACTAELKVVKDAKDDTTKSEEALEAAQIKIQPLLRTQAYSLSNLHIMLKSLALIFNNADLLPNGENSTTNIASTFFIDLCNNILARRNNPNNKSKVQSPATDVIGKRLFTYFQGYWDKLIKVHAFRPCVSLLELLISIISIQHFDKDLGTNRADISRFASEALMTRWTHKISTQSIAYLLNTHFKYNADTIVVLNEMAHSLVGFIKTREEKKLKKNKKKKKKKTTKKKKSDGKKKGKKSKNSEEEEEEEEEEEDDEEEEAIDQDNQDDEEMEVDDKSIPTLSPSTSLVFLKTIFGHLVDGFPGMLIEHNLYDTVSYVHESVKIFRTLMEISSFKGGSSTFLVEILRNGKNYIASIIKHFVPKLKECLKDCAKETMDSVRDMQRVTRTLQAICTHGKTNKDTSITKLVPLVKKTLESFLAEIKLVFTSMGYHNAFETATLKKKSLQGVEINDEVSDDSEHDEDQESFDEKSESEQSDREEEEEEEEEEEDDEESRGFDVDMEDDEEEGSVSRDSKSDNEDEAMDGEEEEDGTPDSEGEGDSIEQSDDISFDDDQDD